MAFAGAFTITQAFSGQGSVYYEYKVVAKTSSGLYRSFDRSPSINDSGQVAFVGRRDGAGGRQTENLFVFDSATASTRQVMNSQFELPRDGAAPLHQFPGAVQMNNSSAIVARRRLDAIVQVGPPFGSILTAPLTYLERWNGAATTLPTQVAMGNGGVGAACGLLFWLNPVSAGTLPSPYDCGSQFSAIFPNPSINNFGGVVFSALQTNNRNALVTSTSAGNILVQLDAELPRPMIADNNNFVFRLGSANPGGQIVVLPPGFFPFIDTIASASTTPSFLNVGRAPGISDDGAIVAFIGETANNGGGQNLGLYVSFREPAGQYSDPVAVLGSNFSPGVIPRAELGYDAFGNPIFFSSFDVDSRVAVSHVSLGRPGYQDDSIVVTFLATPSGASRDNPHLPGIPLLFSANRGLWTARVDIEPNLQPGSSGFGVHSNAIRPVYQIGDNVAGDTVSDLSVNDAIAGAPRSLPGAAQRIDDHRLAFHVTFAGGEAILTAEYLDSDEDGLPDFWETAGKGIDIDRDGFVDLDLAAMGADSTRRDLFLEIDWTRPRINGYPNGWTNEPAPLVNEMLAQMFAAAPATPSGVPAGIVLHIDAGRGKDRIGRDWSYQFPRSLAQGGDLIGQLGAPLTHLDLVGFGFTSGVGLGVLQQRSFDELKQVFFGSADKSARELAFRYVVLSDTHSFAYDKTTQTLISGSVVSSTATTLSAQAMVSSNAVGHWLMIHSGAGAGQMRRIKGVSGSQVTVSPGWTTIPNTTSQWIALSASSGRAEAEWYNAPNLQGIPGNDLIVCSGSLQTYSLGAGLPLANTDQQWRTLAHELGHTFGLRHGGVDHNTQDSSCQNKKCNYFSLMNYSYQSAPAGTPCCAGSCNACPVISYAGSGDPVFADWLNLKLASSASPVHLNQSLGLGLGVSTYAPDEDLPAEFLLGQEAGSSPTVSLSEPLLDSPQPLGLPIHVVASAFDVDSDLREVIVSFDTNGDRVDGPDELFTAVFAGGSQYVVDLPPSVGPSGIRTVIVVTIDRSGLLGSDRRSVFVGCLGDLDGDNLVDDTDFSIFVVAYDILDCEDSAMPPGCPADISGDALVDDSDFVIFLAAYNALLCP